MSASMNANVAENNYGYIYCMSNSGLRENTYKLGFTKRDPINRVRQLHTVGVEPFVIEFAKKVKFQKEKFQYITSILDEHDYRISVNMTYYHCEIDLIRNLFTSINGVWYIPNDEDDDEEYENYDDEHEDTDEDNEMIIDEPEENPHHVMRNVFHDGQAIRHTVEGHGTWTGHYDRTNDAIIHNGILYRSLPEFVEHHREVGNANLFVYATHKPNESTF
jgi:hypothetical protein